MMIVLGIVLLNIQVFAIPQIYPSILEVNLEDKKLIKEEIMIQNSEDTKKKYRISIAREGDFGFEITDHMVVFPKILEIDPKSQKKVFVAFRNIPYNEVKDGEYRAVLIMTEIDSGLEKKYKSRDVESGKIGTQLDIKFEIAMTVYLRKGELKAGLEIVKFDIQKDQVTGKIENTGNYSFIPKVNIINNGKITETTRLPKILRGETMPFSLSVKKGETIEITDEKGNKILEKINS